MRQVPIGLYDKATGEKLVELAPEQLRQLQDALEEEFPEDRDYYLNPDTLDYLLDQGVDAEVVDRLREVMGTREGFDVLWRAEETTGAGSAEAMNP